MKLRTKIMLLIISVILVILVLNRYPVSMSLRQSITERTGSALMDIAYQASVSPNVIEGLSAQRPQLLKAAAEQVERCENCSGIAIFDEKGTLRYCSETMPNAEALRAQITENKAQKNYRTTVNDAGTEILCAYCPIYGRDGNRLGGVLTQFSGVQAGINLEKAQRDLDAMTILVMIIALLIAWNVTENIKEVMFNLEPVEIAQLLTERNALIDSVRDGILSVDGDGTIDHINRTAIRLLRHSYKTEQTEQLRFEDIFPRLSLTETMQNDRPVYDFRCDIGSDSFYVNFIPICIKKPDHTSLLVTFRPTKELIRFAEDITGVKSYIEALRAQMHEFNNKLQVVSGLIRSGQYEELNEYIDALAHLKNQEILQINRTIKDPIIAAFISSKFDRAAEEKVDLVLTDQSCLRVNLPQDLVQDLVVIIGNLLENAFSAVQNCAMQTVTLELSEHGGEIIVSVWDSGIEIPEALLDNLFDYGVTTKESGSGIGLYLVREACTRNGGYITVVSDRQDGTEFVAHISYRAEQEENEHVSSTDCGR
ncbi:hypothetical protein B6K86_05680 [Lachnospiraceae bacterium]|nr:hypothetical protein B6K86_05680 [Lachnospiraceae bacterium]